jgi:hypothetical protein
MVSSPRAIACGLVLAAACGTSHPSSTPGDAPDHSGPPGSPGLGAHALNHYGAGASTASSIATPTMATQASGSTIVVSVGRGQIGLFELPTDSQGNAPYRLQDDVHTYTHYPSSGTALYTFAGANGGTDFKVTTRTSGSDEITLAAVEVVGRTKIQGVAWNEVVQPAGGPQAALTSHQVTTSGPATLVAFWWGDAPEPMVKTAVPNNGFTVIDAILAQGALVQCAVAARDVPAAGTYDVTWAATPVQGAQLWLIAVE